MIYSRHDAVIVRYLLNVKPRMGTAINPKV
jgi:hypothetical protein